MHSSFTAFIIFIIIIAFLVMLAHRFKISYPIVLVIGGLALSFLPGMPRMHIEPEMVFLIFLPPLLYDAAWQTSWKEFWKWRRVITSFAFLIVLLTSCVVAIVSSNLIPGFTLALGFLLGGIVSPPDAVSATTVLKSVKVPKRLTSIIEGESLLNDASSLIVFRFALAAVQSGKFVFWEAAGNFFLVIIMGIVTGVAIGLVFFAIHRWLPTTPNIDIVLTFVTPYMMYIVAEHFHFSGVLAVVSGGLFLSSRQHIMLSHRSRIQGLSVWSIVGFLFNGIIFMLIGLQLPTIVEQLGNISLFDAVFYGLLISLVLIITRLICTLGTSVFTKFISRYIKTADNDPGWRGPLIFGWAGMRGVVSLAAALSIPLTLSTQEAFPQRNLILFITFMVILVTLVFQGLTLPWVVRKLDMKDPDSLVSPEIQDKKVRRKMTQIALDKLNNQYSAAVNSNDMIRSMKSTLENHLKYHHEEPKPGEYPEGKKPLEEFYKISCEIINEQRQLLLKLNAKAELDEDVVKKHLVLLDQEEEQLKQQFGKSEPL